MKLSTAKRRINKTLDELCKSVVDDWYANFKNGYIKGYEDARQGKSPMYAEAYKVADTPQTDLNCLELPNNCEHITEDGVTCAKYPACDDCLDNPLNKVKGSERLVKGSEQTDCQTCKWWSSYGYCVHRECKGYAPQTGRSSE